MSLFPAYCASDSNSENASGPSWLNNSSFNALKNDSKLPKNSNTDFNDSDSPPSPSSPQTKRRKSKKSSKKKKDKNTSDELFYEDTTPLAVPSALPQVQLTKPSSRRYVEAGDNRIKKVKCKKTKKKVSVKNRYFGKGMEEVKNIEFEMLHPAQMNIEEFLKLTENFNKNLRNDPHNVKMWLDYVKLQDSGAGSFRGRNEKKLSILDKALEENPESDELLHQKMLITETLYPMDKITAEALAIVTKYPQNLIGWLWVLNSSQCNLSKMTAPGVLLTYQQVLEGVNRAHKDSKPFIDFLFLCGLFLRQCGLWEQLWVLLEMYLELSLSQAGSGAFSLQVKLPDDEIRRLEDSIITSGLPLGSLWLRTERLREGVYFTAVEDSTDPQRVVFREDLTSLLFPVSPSSSLSLIVTTLLLLKVPPLPLTQAFVNYSGVLKVPSFLDSVEFILAAKASGGDSSYLQIVPELLLGPQYLSDNLGREEYFTFVNSVFEKCITYCCESDKVCLLSWQMRWWRWVFSFLQSRENSSASEKKQFLSLAKKVLKQNRDETPLYTEYALLESQLGDFESAIKVLETAINLRDPPLLTGTLYKRDLCHLYRVYIELLIKKDQDNYKNKIMSSLIGLAFGEPVQNITPRDELVKKCSDKFKHITSEMLRDIKDRPVNLIDVIFPDFSVSWLLCHSWFLYLTEGVWESLALLGNAIKELNSSSDSNDGNLLDIMQEELHMGIVEIFTHHSRTHPGNNNMLFELAEKALKCYPNNAFFLNTVFSCELPNIKWSKFLSDVIGFESALSSALVYFMTHSRLSREEGLRGTALPRLEGLLEKLNRGHERCPLFWRLLLQASSMKESQDIKRIFYMSLEKCPWVKVLYYEAAKILPEDLPEIQDLIVEKELRLHITPEELEILREDS